MARLRAIGGRSVPAKSLHAECARAGGYRGGKTHLAACLRWPRPMACRILTGTCPCQVAVWAVVGGDSV
jgi:hypothetical protein